MTSAGNPYFFIPGGGGSGIVLHLFFRKRAFNCPKLVKYYGAVHPYRTNTNFVKVIIKIKILKTCIGHCLLFSGRFPQIKEETANGEAPNSI